MSYNRQDTGLLIESQRFIYVTTDSAAHTVHCAGQFLARYVIYTSRYYISRLCYDASVGLSVRDGSALAHYS